MTLNKESKENEKNQLKDSEEQENGNDDNNDNETEYTGRDWSKILVGVIFIFIVTVGWYVIKAIIGLH